jgi:hypothetical protein
MSYFAPNVSMGYRGLAQKIENFQNFFKNIFKKDFNYKKLYLIIIIWAKLLKNYGVYKTYLQDESLLLLY